MEELVATLTFEDLIEELARRFPTMVFAGHQTKLGTGNGWVTRTSLEGPLPFCLGLAELLKGRCADLISEDVEEDEE